MFDIKHLKRERKIRKKINGQINKEQKHEMRIKEDILYIKLCNKVISINSNNNHEMVSVERRKGLKENLEK